MMTVAQKKQFLSIKTSVFAFLVSFLSFSVFAQKMNHVEPPFWWADMKQTELEIMFHGENISYMEVDCPKLTILGIKKTENPNYIFLTIDTKSQKAGIYEVNFKLKNKTVYTHKYELKARRENSAERKSFSSADVMYLLMPDRFANGDEKNDSHTETVEKVNRSENGGRHGGDIQGIIDHLDYINDLGATAIWSTPMLEDNDSTYSYHTYGQSNFYKIDPRYGTNDDYRRLADEMHKRDLKLVMDYVTNHWGASHWMMQDLPTYTWIHQFPGYSQTNYRMSTQMDPNFADIDFKNCMDGWFVKSMPDLNQSNPLVLNYLTQNAIWWIEFADLDGFRVDTYSYNDKEGIAKWTKAITDEYPNFNIVGEVWLHNQAQISYWQKDSKISAIQSYNTYLPSVMDFCLHDVFGNVFHEINANWSDGMIKLYDNFVNDFLYPDVNNLLLFLENHDTQRFNESYKNLEDYKLAITLLGTIRGTPQLYYGTEIGMAGDKGKGDGEIRQDFPGGWKEDKNNAFSSSSRTAAQKEYFEFTKKIMSWRKTSNAIHVGKTKQYLPDNNVYVYFRYTAEESVMVIINNSDKKQSLSLNRFEESTKNFNNGTDILSGKSLSLKEKVFEVPAKSSFIFELK
jgi:glycosidase